MYDIAIILINYNSSQFTIDAVNSIISKTSPEIKYQIIIIDNASKYDDYNLLKKAIEANEFNQIVLFRSRINTGFGGGNMLGVQFANAKYYAFINNDTLLKNDCLKILFSYMNQNQKVALCAPQGFDENDEVLNAFDHFLTLGRELFGRKIFEIINPKKYPKRNKIYKNPVKVQCIPGSFLFVDAATFNKVGGFDTNIFLYYEETDLAYRISKLDGRNECFLVPQAKYNHFEGKSTNKGIVVKKELKLSLLYVLRKNSSYFSALVLRLIMIIKYFFKSFISLKYVSLLTFVIIGAPLSLSLKNSQKILSK